MKKVIHVLCFVFCVHGAIAQNSAYRRDSLFQILEKAKTPAEEVTAWGDICDHYGYVGQIDSVLYANEQMLKIALDSHDKASLADAYIHIASYYSITSDYKQSLEYQFKGLAYAEEAERPELIWLATKETGIVFKKLKNYREALRYLQKAESVANDKPTALTDWENRTYTHMAEVYLGLNEADSALHFIQLANENTLKDVDAYGYARVLYIFATVYKARGENDLAESYYKKCINFSDMENINSPFTAASTDYGKYLFDNKQYDLSREYALRAFNEAMETRNRLGIIEAASLLRKVYYALGEKDSSFYYSDVKDAYSDSVFNEHQRNQIQNLSFSQQIKEREEQEKLSQEERGRKMNIQYALIAIGIILLFTIYLLLSRSFITNAKLIEFFGVVALLIVFEFLNLLLHPFLERITHHNPVLMLLALVAIAALLVPLHHRIELWATARLVEKNKLIRLAAAKRTIQQLDKEPGNETE